MKMSLLVRMEIRGCIFRNSVSKVTKYQMVLKNFSHGDAAYFEAAGLPMDVLLTLTDRGVGEWGGIAGGSRICGVQIWASDRRSRCG
jgi:hypothetical protein